MLCVDGAPIKAKITHMRTGTSRIIRDILLPVFKHIIGLEHRLRLRMHAGTDEETAADLETYGLTSSQQHILMCSTEQVATFSEQWLQERREIEERAH